MKQEKGEEEEVKRMLSRQQLPKSWGTASFLSPVDFQVTTRGRLENHLMLELEVGARALSWHAQGPGFNPHHRKEKGEREKRKIQMASLCSSHVTG